MSIALKYIRDRRNRVLYGPGAPISDEAYYVSTNSITHMYVPNKRIGAPNFRRGHSGIVIGGDWDLSRTPLKNSRKYEACYAHWVKGVSWCETGIFDLHMDLIQKKGESDGCRTLSDVKKRYENLDRLYESVERDGRLCLRSELNSKNRREDGGIFVVIDRNGCALRKGGGEHRFAVARILNIPEIPVQAGAIHISALKNGCLNELRCSIFFQN